MLAAFAFALLPVVLGWPLQNRFHRSAPQGFPERVAQSVFLGAGLLGLCFSVGFFLETRLLLPVALAAGISCIAALGARGQRWRLRQCAPTLIATLALAALLFLVGTDEDGSSDGFYHLGIVRKILEQGHLGIENFRLSRELAFGSGTYLYNAVYPIYAGVAQTFGIDPIRLWMSVPGPLAILLTLAFMGAAQSLLGSLRSQGPLLATWFLFSFWVSNQYAIAAFPHQMGLLFYLGCIGSLLRLRRAFFLHGMLASAGLVVHPQFLLFYGMTVTLGIAVFFFTHRRRAYQWAVSLAASILFALPVAALRFRVYWEFRDDFAQMHTSLYAPLFSKLFGVSFFNVFLALSIFSWIGFLAAAFFLYRAVRSPEKRRAPRFVLALLVVLIPTAILNPISFLFFSKFLTQTIVLRMALLIDLWGGIFLADTLAVLARRVRLRYRFPFPHRLLRWSPLLLVGAWFWVDGPTNPFQHNRQARMYSRLYGGTLGTLLRATELRSLLAQIPRGARVLTDSRAELLVLRDLLVVGDYHDVHTKGQEINRRLFPVFGVTATPETLAPLFEEFKPEYLLLSPYSSPLDWIRYARYPEKFERLGQAETGSEFHDGIYTLYRIRPGAWRARASQLPPIAVPSRCPARPVIYSAHTDLPLPDLPTDWEARLRDGQGTAPENRVTYVARRPASKIDLHFPEPTALDRVEVTVAVAPFLYLDGLALYVLGPSGPEPVETKFFAERPATERLNVRLSGRGVLSSDWRVVVFSHDSTSIADVTAYSRPRTCP